MVCEEGDKLTYSKHGRFCHEVKINYSPYVNYFTRVYWNRSSFVYKINTVISFQSWKIAEPSCQRHIPPEVKYNLLVPTWYLLEIRVWTLKCCCWFSLLLLTGSRVLWRKEDQTLLSFGKMSNLPLCSIPARCLPYCYNFTFQTVVKFSS